LAVLAISINLVDVRPPPFVLDSLAILAILAIKLVPTGEGPWA
jgi:hypothetical protein